MKRISYILLITQTIVTTVFSQNLPNPGSGGIVNNTIQGSIVSQILPSPYNANGNPTPSKYNYVRTYEPLIPITNANTITTGSHQTQVALSTTYTDGWGRTIQKVYRNKTSAMSRHLVECFDNRPSNTNLGFLPYVSNTFKFQQTPFTSQHNFYPTDERGTALSKNVNNILNLDNTISTRTYSLGKTNIGQDRYTETKYLLNTANHIYTININLSTGKPQKTGYYSPSVLHRNVTQTPDGSYKEEYYDKEGKLICVREFVDNVDCSVGEPGNPPVAMAMGGGPNVAQCPVYRWTYYVYDDFGRLSHVISPKAWDKLVNNGWQFTNSIIDNLMDYYIYDEQGRVVEKHTAGQNGNESYVYDKKDRKVLTQTPFQRQNAQWSFILYDKLDRPTVTGLLVNGNSTLNRLTWQTWLSTVPCPISSSLNNANNLEYYIGFDNGEGTYPTYLVNCELLNYTIYDDYVQVPGITFDATVYTSNTTNNGYSVIPSVSYRTKGLKTATMTRVVKPVGTYYNNVQDWITTVFFYDDYGRVIQTKTENHRGGWDIAATQYDFKGRILNTIQHHQNPLSSKPNTKVYTNHTYQNTTMAPAGVFHRIDNANSWKELVLYSYDELGRVTRKTIGDVENQDYGYNVRGDVTGINANYAEGALVSSITFGESIKYYNSAFSQPLHDGNISGIVWRGPNASKPRAYGYTYDKLGRLRSAEYREYSDALNPGNYTWNINETDFTENNISYDKNGNIKTLNRYGLGTSGGPVAPEQIDELIYTYADNDVSNKLDQVTDGISLGNQLSDYDFKDNNASTGEYVYNWSGKLQEDKNKGITIVNNFFNKPDHIIFNSGDVIRYVYDAYGNKVMEIYEGSNTDIYDYIGAFTYKNLELYTIAHEEGYALKKPDNSFDYHFFIKDHLGNVRNIVTPIATPIHVDYLATHEIASAGLESFVFGNIDSVRATRPDNPAPGDVMAARLNASESERTVGTSLVIKVMAGDKIGLSAESYYNGEYNNEEEPSTQEMLGAIISTLANGQGGFEGGAEGNGINHIEQLFSTNNYVDVYNNILYDNIDPNRPKAFLNYIFFDENHHIVPEQSGAIQIGETAGQWNIIGTEEPIVVGRNGYLAMYISTLTRGLDVYMDLVSLVHYTGQLVEENHYYPYGLTVKMAANNPVNNKLLYQTKSLNKYNNLHYYEFPARQYDPQLGRFNSIDPIQQFFSGYIGMGNDPVRGIDKDGKFRIDYRVAEAYPYVAQMVQYYFPLLAKSDYFIDVLYNFTHQFNDRNMDFTKQQLRDMFSYGNGPWLNVAGDARFAVPMDFQHPINMDKNQYDKRYPNDIWITKDNFDNIQGAMAEFKKNQSTEKFAMFELSQKNFVFSNKVLHEGGHYLFDHAFKGNRYAKDVDITGDFSDDRGYQLTNMFFGDRLSKDVFGTESFSTEKALQKYNQIAPLTPWISNFAFPFYYDFNYLTLPNTTGNGYNPSFR